MPSINVIGHPKPDSDWVHRFRNFGEEVYVRLRASCDVRIAEIDAAIDQFHVGGVDDERAASVADFVESLCRAHHLDDSVLIKVEDTFTLYEPAILVVDTSFGEKLWEIAGRYPVWVVHSDVNRAAVERIWAAANEQDEREDDEREGVTIWSNRFEPVTEGDWIGVLQTIDIHHGQPAREPPFNKLSVYGATVTPAIASALR
ncbi:MAG: hypothetical protein ACRD3J_04755, partial [Thermoanaerobaculia bacterium]